MAKSNVGPNALGPGTRASSKHWENYERHPLWSVQRKCASKAEVLFFEWLWKREREREEGGP